MLSTIPLVSGFHDVIVYGAFALKLKALFRAKVWPFQVICEKLPTAYMVLPHCTICRIFSFPVVGFSAGVPLAGVAETAPAGAIRGAPEAGEATDASAVTPTASAPPSTHAPVVSRRCRIMRIMTPYSAISSTRAAVSPPAAQLC